MSTTPGWSLWSGHTNQNTSSHGFYLLFDNGTHHLQSKRLVPTVLCVSTMIFFAVGGNLLVLLSYCRDPRLRTVSNVYICHLAICDLLLGGVSMTLHLYLTVSRDDWRLGPIFCKLYLMNDYTLCAQSAFLVVLISLDKLLILRKGILYVTEETKRKAYIRIGLAWLAALLLYSPAILIWDYCVGNSVLEPHQCDTEFYNNKIFTLTTAVIEFVGPFTALLILNTCVYLEIRKRTRKTHNQRKVNMASTGAPEQVSLHGAPRAISDRGSDDKSESGGDSLFVLFPDRGGPTTCQTMDDRSDNEGNNSGSSDDSSSEDNSSWVQSSMENRSRSSPGEAEAESSKMQSYSRKSLYGRIFGRHPREKTTDTLAESNAHEAESSTVAIAPSSLHSTDCHADAPRADNSHQESLGPRLLPGGNIVKDIRISNDNQQQQIATGKDNKSKVGLPTLTFNTLEKKDLGQKPADPSASKETRRHRRLLNANALKLRKDLKAAKNLFVFIFTFGLCWAPYTISTIIIAYCQEDCVDESAHQLFTWLLWLKSSINPFLYAASSSRFRFNFAKILGYLFFCCPNVCEKIWLSPNDFHGRFVKK